MNFQVDHAREILSRTPTTLHSLLHRLPQEWTLADEGPDSWSPYDVVGHLIHGEETDWIPRATHILEHGESRPFEPFDRFAMLEKSGGRSMSDLLARFEQVRTHSLNALEQMRLTPELMEKRGVHPELGVVTLRQLLATWVAHDLSHIGQVARVMAKQYGGAVGPWRAYLPILSK